MNFVGDNLILIVGQVGFLLLMALFGLLAGLLSKPKTKTEAPDTTYQRDDYPYEREDYLLSPSERTFYNALDKAVGTDLHIFQKVRLIDIVRVRPGTPNPQGHKNSIDRKHVDFVVCDQGTHKPMVVIELDDASHQRARSQESGRCEE